MKIQAELSSCKTFLFDCDGVLWYGDCILNKSDVALKILRERGYGVYFVTNSSQKCSHEVLKKLQTLNIDASIEDIEAHDSQHPKERLDIGAVIVGHDRTQAKNKIQKAVGYLVHMETLYFSTNVDYDCNHNDPPTRGLGSIIHKIRRDTLRMPDVFGKPSSNVWNYLNKRYGMDQNTTCVVGDNVCTDIAFGKRNNLKTVLVMCGDTSEKDLETWEQYYQSNHEYYVKNHARPDVICEDVQDFVDQLCIG